MAIKKELLISTKFDTSDFDKAVERMQNKLKDLYAPSDMVRAQTMTANRLNQYGIGGGQPKSHAEYQRTAMQSRRELDSYIREQAQGQQKLAQFIDKRAQKMVELRDRQKELTKGTQEELEIREKLVRMENNLYRQREYYLERNKTLNQGLDARNKVAPRDIPGLLEAFRGGGLKYGMSQIPGALRQNPLGMGGSLLGLASSGLIAGSEFYRDWKGMPMRSEAATGSAVQGTFGRDINNIYGRRSVFEQNFQDERQRAAQMSIERNLAERRSDKASLAGNLGLVGAGTATAVGTGWTGIGALAGVGAAGTGLWRMLSDERQRSLMLSPFSKTANNRYESMLNENLGKNYGDTYEALKNQNPFKTQAVGEYEQNYMRNLQAQRQMGLGDEGLYGEGGFFRKNLGAGFLPEMGLEMAGNIQGAGGSTRMQRESVFGNQLSRGLNLTNAGSILGTLSGQMGGAEVTKQATIKILAEGMKQGLDDSKFVEENRRFTQAAAEIIARTGARGGDVDRVASEFGKGLSENTMRGIEGARTAYEEYQNISSTTTGPRGVMRAAAFLKDDKLSKLSTVEKQAIMQIPEGELNEDNLLVAGAAEKLGISPKDLVDRIKGANEGSVSRFKEADQLRDKLKSRMKELGITKISRDNLKSLPADVRMAAYNLGAFQTTELGNKGEIESYSRLNRSLGAGAETPFDIQSDRESILRAKAEGRDTGRMGDTTVGAMAQDASIVNREFNKMRGEMDETAKSVLKFGEAVRDLNVQLQKALEDARNGKGNTNVINDLLQKLMTASGNQVQGGKVSK